MRNMRSNCHMNYDRELKRSFSLVPNGSAYKSLMNPSNNAEVLLSKFYLSFKLKCTFFLIARDNISYLENAFYKEAGTR